MKAFRKFKRFEDDKSQKEERRIKASTLSSKRRSKRDQSSLPFLSYEDSNGLSPVNEKSRWETLETKGHTDENSFNHLDIAQISKRNISYTKTPSRNGENIKRQQESTRTANTQEFQPFEEKNSKLKEKVFDPFYIEDLEDHGSLHEFFDLTGSEWDEFETGTESFKSFVVERDSDRILKQQDDLFEHPCSTSQGDVVADQSINLQTTNETINELHVPEADVISVSSFPMRVKPIEFLKKRIVEEDDSYAGEIFMKLGHETHHSRSLPRKRESIIETVEEVDSEEDEVVSSCENLQLEIEIQTSEDRIEVVDTETIVSANEFGTMNCIASSEEHLEIVKDTKDDAEATNESLQTKFLADNDDDTHDAQDIQGRMSTTKLDKLNTDQSRIHDSPKTIGVDGTGTFPLSIEQSEGVKERERSAEPTIEDTNDTTNPLGQVMKLAAPLLSADSNSFKDDPMRIVAEKLGISMVNKPYEEPHQVPLNVEIMCKKPFAPEKTGEEREIHRNRTNKTDRARDKKLMSPSTGSLLDSVTEVSDFHSSSTSSTSTMISHPNLETIDLKSLHSGSVSGLSFHGKQLSIPPDADIHNGENIKESSISSIKIPRGPTRRTKADFASVTEQENEPIRCKTKGSKPLGATSNEIEMINKFLAIAGTEFDGTSLTIEQREQIHNKALRAGLAEVFINKMLDRSAGILQWDHTVSACDESSEKTDGRMATGETSSKLERSKQTLQMKDTADDETKVTMESSLSEDYTYDEDGFVRKTPTEDTFSCLKNIFWMESSNVVGDDMTENILAVMSADSESLYSRRNQFRR